MAQIWARCCRTIPGFDFRDMGPPLMKILKEEIKFEKSGLCKTGVPARWEQSRGAGAGTSRSSPARLAARLPLCCCGFTLKAAGFVVLSWCPFTVTPHSSASSLCLPRRWCQSREWPNCNVEVFSEFENSPKKSKRFQKMSKQITSKLLGLLRRKICQVVKNLSALPTEAGQLRAPVDPHWQIASPTQSSYSQSTDSPGELQT